MLVLSIALVSASLATLSKATLIFFDIDCSSWFFYKGSKLLFLNDSSPDYLLDIFGIVIDS